MQRQTVEFLSRSAMSLDRARKRGRFGITHSLAGGSLAIWKDILLNWAKKHLKQVVITNQPVLAAVLREEFSLGEKIQVLSHVTEDDVKGAHVFGVLPLHLAVKAALVTEVILNIPPELQGVELSEDQIRKYMMPVETYEVRLA